jgi:shikimate dehydrogenase
VATAFKEPIDAGTRYCAVYGHPIRHSASPAMQNAGMAALGLNWRYLAFPVHPDHLRAALEGARRMKFVGVNLTVPHKLLALGWVDVLDESARIWGAVNTVRFEARDEAGAWQPLRRFDGDIPEEIRAHGFNTDADAIVQSIREDLNLELKGATVLQLGVGGAGRVAALKLASEGVSEIHLINRTAPKAEAVAEEIRQRFPSVHVQLGYPSGGVDLVLNATSLGLNAEDPLPWDEKRFPMVQAGAVYDMVYHPACTSLLRAAKAAGRPTANGLGMLLYQGAKALELWSGQPPPIAEMRQALTKHIHGH